jgi:hypothetical protein
MAKLRGRPPVSFDDRLALSGAGCLEWTGTTVRGGYGQVRVGRKMVYAHRVAFERSKGEIPEGMFVCHSCDNPPCCNPDHLFLGTHQENMSDKVAKGRQTAMVGTKNPSSKLTEDDVRQIRKLYADGINMPRLAAVFGVTKQAIYLIVHRRKWQHIP